jgi:hypothetical protein
LIDSGRSGRPIGVPPTLSDEATLAYSSTYFRDRTLDDIQLSYVKYDIPIKGGAVYSTYAVNPISGDKSSVLKVEELLRNTFLQNSIEVSVKMQNSMKFYQKCRELRGPLLR